MSNRRKSQLEPGTAALVSSSEAVAYERPEIRDVIAQVLGAPDVPEFEVLSETRSVPIAFHFENILLGHDGSVFVVGWIDDRNDPLETIDCRSGQSCLFLSQAFQGREFREDLGRLVSGDRDARLGFWSFKNVSGLVLCEDRMVSVRLTLRSGQTLWQTLRAQVLNAAEMRKALMRYNLLSSGTPAASDAPGHASLADLATFLAGAHRRVAAARADQSRGPGFDVTDASVSSQIVVYDASSGPEDRTEPRPPRCGVDALFASAEGAVLVVGWVDDSEEKLEGVRVIGPGWEACAPGAAVARARRPDVETELGTSKPHAFGLWCVITGRSAISLEGGLQVEFTLADGGARTLVVADVKTVDTAELRDVALGYFASCAYHGSPQVEAQAQLDFGLGARLVALNRAVSRRFVANPYVRRFTHARCRPRASIVICLYGRPEFLFLQAAAFSLLPGFTSDYELVYVSNSPDLSERLHNDARIAHRVYGVDITLVLLSGNAGFGAANNLGARSCRTDRILVVNPDVFPRTPDWAARHLALVDSRPAEETRLFGVPLFYEDGSMMHAGMYLDLDPGLSWTSEAVTARPMVRVEHYAKGAPSSAARYLQSRPVPAVTGAFMSLDRKWFEDLGGFTEDYVFGHYEDADLCLKSLQRDAPVWLHDVGLLHLEGKGSTRQAAHEGGSIVNRWLFSQRWRDVILDGLQGLEPPRLAAIAGSPAPADVPRARLPNKDGYRRPRKLPADAVGRRSMMTEPG